MMVMLPVNVSKYDITINLISKSTSALIDGHLNTVYKRIAELEKQHAAKVVTPKKGVCECGAYCTHYGERAAYCPECGTKLKWEDA